MTDPLAAARLMADECLCFRARRASRALTRIYDAALRPVGLQATQLTLLNAVALSEAEGRPMSEVAEFLGMDPTTLSRNIRPLEAAGLIRLEGTPGDARVRLARITPRGGRLIARALPLWRRAHGRILAALGPDVAAELRDQFDAADALPRKLSPVHA